MASAASRTFSILPLILLHSRSSSFYFFRRLALRSSSTSAAISSAAFPSFRRSYHSPLHSLQETSTTSYLESSHGGSNSWPEWLEFFHWAGSEGECADGSEFVQEVEMSEEFFMVACGWMDFATDYPDLIGTLSREDIEVVVDNGSPFLFKDAFNTTRRMKSFLSNGLNDVAECDKPTTIDLMRFLLSYAHMAIVSSDKKPMINRVESSVRKLFGELAKSRRFYADYNASAQNQFSERYVQTSSFVQKTIEMRRGDWICPRCSFMNFARNSTCRKCEEARPKKHLTGGDWECPQCNFLNFGRNAVCLRCDCRKTGQNPPQSLTPALSFAARNSLVKGQPVDKQGSSNHLENPSNLGSNDFTVGTRNMDIDGSPGGADHQTTGVDINLEISQYLDHVLDGKSKSNTSDVEDHLGENLQAKNQAEKSEEWFKKVTELHDVEDLSNSTSDEDFPKMMPVRKGQNRFVVGKKKDRSLTSPMYKRQMAMEQQSGNNKYVPFVPFPPGYFGTSDTSSTANQQFGAISSNAGMEDKTASTVDINSSNNMEQPRKSSDLSQQFGAVSSNSGMEDKTTNPFDNNSSNSTMEQPRKSSDLSSSSSGNNYSMGESSGWRGMSLEGSAVREPDPLDMSEEAKAERWFRRVAQIKDISELSQIPDEDFPSIMPMRKGVNRFVVSKRKTLLERRLTSSQYRRNPPVAGNSEAVNKEKESD